MTIKMDRELFMVIDSAAQQMPMPNRTFIIEGLLRYALGHEKSVPAHIKAQKGYSR